MKFVQSFVDEFATLLISDEMKMNSFDVRRRSMQRFDHGDEVRLKTLIFFEIFQRENDVDFFVKKNLFDADDKKDKLDEGHACNLKIGK